MPVVLFIIDNSASMNQVTYLGTSYLDLAKSAVENFLKVNTIEFVNSKLNPKKGRMLIVLFLFCLSLSVSIDG